MTSILPTLQVIRIFESILTPKLSNFEAEVKTMGKAMASATLAVYKGVLEQFLPTPEKFHYLFNIRDVSKVVQGLLMMRPVQVPRKGVDKGDHP